MNMLIGMVAHAREDTEVGRAGVVDEACGTGQDLSVYLDGRGAENRVMRERVAELVERKEVDVFALRDGGGGASLVRYVRGKDLADVFVDELAALDGDG
jgi:hypothetical protein